jgi:hypothetical protein
MGKREQSVSAVESVMGKREQSVSAVESGTLTRWHSPQPALARRKQ